ncbi:hypothetical protein A2630_03710 [Candidatus Woesebacteria bacterium RIFCSPHIGHO2_01_FULL_44_10]|uniref:L,D-TPase catalytic domain-containing protein n=1 Tax=Candidatus Woesebacteria bacterium RIFCSPLOWO2_01_FULL_44_14 TaxID=1802525 RepID=A0A1F8C2E3_9BACT|nr:MAG: hypothetical protein A2630_03710 [Candidatus Woesebacteria bacterium RIFCSPHIGHO2_01_FULL_44_10]OGM54899.1 MAG: hypothetical protein A3F62_04405 [Candidatus Woesebacteria bacterium RIFCSPHIGHO2_12_FULL_44_11]OGM70310.1 MAG: hypothetical protein A2975_04550 [Candidatus Woesebacteria bacterium RIFCSPLOWO2_01_FULL_44_14]
MRQKFWAIIPLALIIALLVLAKTKEKVSSVAAACTPMNYTGSVESENIGTFFGQKVAVPTLAEAEYNSAVLGVADSERRWVEVDLSEQRLRAWDGNELFLETAISTGLPWWPTPTGEFRIWVKLRSTKMEGGEGKYYYNLPNVPYVMYFEGSGIPRYRGYGLHGTYWHNSFGTPRSHGCVNLPTPVAQRLYSWTTPVIPDGKGVVFADENNKGTRIVIHD